jgi:O-antigen/teichoic acid export membrane protein
VRPGRTVAASLASLVSGDLLNRIFRFAATVVLARALSLTEFGELNTAIAVAGVAAIIANAGLADLGTREVAIERLGASDLASKVLAIRLVVLGAEAGLVVILFVFVSGADIGLLAAGGVMTLSMTLAGDWILRGLERMRTLALAWALGGGTVAVGAALCAWGPKTAQAALWAYAGGEAVVAMVGWLALRRVVRPGLSVKSWAPLVRKAWPIAVSTVVIYAYTANIDTIVLAATRSKAEAGLYSGPYRVFWVVSAVIVFASYAALPKLSRRSAAGDEETVRSAVTLLAQVLCSYALVAVGISFLVAGPGLGFLFGGHFSGQGDVFMVLMASLAWYAIGFPAGQSLIASGKNRSFMIGAVGAGSLNVVACLVAIPLFGTIGAAAATTLSFAIGSILWLRLRALDSAPSHGLLAIATAITIAAIVAALWSAVSPFLGLACIAAGGLNARACYPKIRAAW